MTRKWPFPLPLPSNQELREKRRGPVGAMRTTEAAFSSTVSVDKSYRRIVRRLLLTAGAYRQRDDYCAGDTLYRPVSLIRILSGQGHDWT